MNSAISKQEKKDPVTAATNALAAPPPDSQAEGEQAESSIKTPTRKKPGGKPKQYIKPGFYPWLIALVFSVMPLVSINIVQGMRAGGDYSGIICKFFQNREVIYISVSMSSAAMLSILLDKLTLKRFKLDKWDKFLLFGLLLVFLLDLFIYSFLLAFSSIDEIDYSNEIAKFGLLSFIAMLVLGVCSFIKRK
ncbi:MAG: hypothetical protein LBM59_02485 [Ruminococcus sp.]|jgi:hypothetical protein|nr:hypothetical protein [Ruminococcus sp.]